MFSRLLDKPVELMIDGKNITFNSLDDFEFSLNARTAISPERLNETISASNAEINDELKSISAAKFEIDRIISRSPDVSSGINFRLKSMNTSIFTKEHHWRDIFIALNKIESLNISGYKNAALKIYLKYLKNRISFAQNIKNKLANKEQQNVNLIQASDDTTIFSSGEGLSTIESEIFQLDPSSETVRIPKGKPVIVKLDDGQKIDLFLAKYRCALVADDGAIFIDHENIPHALLKGENIIGRGKGCHVHLNSELRELSRQHLSIYYMDDKKLVLTDLSSQGSYLPKASIKTLSN